MNRKQKVKRDCANYKDGLCLIRDTECPLVSGFTYRGHAVQDEEIQCDYFITFVDPKQASDKKVVVNFSYKPCKRCGKSFKPATRGTRYCRDICREQARKETYRKVNSKRGI
ncbi:hypothetical protein ACQCWA_19405 [Rossellomorea aquimaris]|uniref:hypothetical protein n=1 Tax=Rossellomorea aquimaris TaxID=189382 RepID=UPI003CFA3949